jgi:hypothetical protein
MKSAMKSARSKSRPDIRGTFPELRRSKFAITCHFAIDDHGGANIYPAIWSALIAARAEGVGGVITTVLCYESDLVMQLLGVPTEAAWGMTAMLAPGYPRGRWRLWPTATLFMK